MTTLPNYPPPAPLDGSELVPVWQAGQQRAAQISQIVPVPFAATSGASLIGADDGASGTLWTTVAGFIARLLSSAGAAVIGVADGGTVENSIGNAAYPFDAAADGATDDRTPLSSAITRGAGKVVRLPGNYMSSSGAAWTDVGTSDPDPSALVVGDSGTVVDGENRGVVAVNTANKGVVHFKNASVSSRPTSNILRNIKLVQQDGDPGASGLRDDYFSARFEATEKALADNIEFYGELGLTFQYAQNVTYYSPKDFDAAAAVSVANDTITVTAHSLATGDALYLSAGTGSTWSGLLPLASGVGFGLGERLYAIVVDANTLKFAGTPNDAAAGTAIDITAVGSGTITLQKDVRRGRYNRSRNCRGTLKFMFMQIFGEYGGVHVGHVITGLGHDGVSRAASHGIRCTGYDFVPMRENRVSDCIVSRFSNGLELQTYVQRNKFALTAIDCQNGVHLARQALRDRVQFLNEIEIITRLGDYGVYDEGGRYNDFRVNISKPTQYGIEALNAGAKTFDGASAVSTGSDTITLTGHGYQTGDGLILTKGTATLPTGTGISNGTQLYAIVVDANTIKLATSQANALAGTAIDITVAGSGTLTAFPTDYSTGNSYRGTILSPGGTRGADLNSVCRATVDLNIIGSGPSSTTWGLICSGPFLSGRVKVRECNVGVLLSSEFACLFVDSAQCTTGLSVSGHNNVVFCNVAGNISVSGNNNTIIGTVAGTVTNTGTGNRIMVSSKTGWTADTGTAERTAHASYTAGAGLTFTDPPTAAEMTALATRLAAVESALQSVTRGQKAIKDDLLALGQFAA